MSCCKEKDCKHAPLARKKQLSISMPLVNDTIDLVKIESGKFTLDEIDFDLRNTIENAVDMSRHIAREKSLGLTALIGATVPSFVRWDPGRLKQILLNFINNAIKFTSQGEVTVIVERLGECAHNARIRVAVRDTGIGISLGDQQKLFSAFVQVDPSTTRKYGGTGLAAWGPVLHRWPGIP